MTRFHYQHGSNGEVYSCVCSGYADHNSWKSAEEVIAEILYDARVINTRSEEDK